MHGKYGELQLLIIFIERYMSDLPFDITRLIRHSGTKNYQLFTRKCIYE